MNQKNSEKQKESQDTSQSDLKWGVVAVVILIIALVVAGYFIFRDNQSENTKVNENSSESSAQVKSQNEDKESKVDVKALVRKLNKSNITIYYSETCGACQEQMELFGDQFDNLKNKVSCSLQQEKCADIQYVPTWKIDGENQVGVKQLEELWQLVN